MFSSVSNYQNCNECLKGHKYVQVSKIVFVIVVVIVFVFCLSLALSLCPVMFSHHSEQMSGQKVTHWLTQLVTL